MHAKQERQLRTGRLMYIFQAALEYLIALAVSGSFLAKLTKEIGMSDSMTGILGGVAALGGVFQLLSMLVRRSRPKKLVLTLSICNQLLFTLLYLIPGLSLGTEISTGLFAVTLVSAYLLLNMASPAKTSWLMSMVEPGRRGVFTARKEMFSLLASMIFTFGMGALFDSMEASGRLREAFGLMAVVMTVCMLLAALTMVIAVERPMPVAEGRSSVWQILRSMLRNRKMRQVFGLHMLYCFFMNAAPAFYGTYQLIELDFSLTLISGFFILNGVVRMIASPYWGRYADRTSFTSMLEKSFVLLGLAYLCAMLAAPANGRIMFGLYYVLNGIAMAGASSAMFNILFDYTTPENQTDAWAVCQSLAGISGFLTTLVFGVVLAVIQRNGSQLFGMTLYAQQLLSLVSALGAFGTIAYIRMFFVKKA